MQGFINLLHLQGIFFNLSRPTSIGILFNSKVTNELSFDSKITKELNFKSIITKELSFDSKMVGTN